MKQIKVDDKTYDLIKSLAEKRQLSMSDVVEEAIHLMLGGYQGDKAITKVVEKYITINRDTKCSKCNRELKVGDKAKYILYIYEDSSKKSYIYCLDCDIESNPTLFKLYIKRKELETVIKQLNSEISRKIEYLKQYEYQIKVGDLKREIYQLVKDLKIYLSNDEEMKKLILKLDDLLTKLDKLEVPPIVVSKIEEKAKKEVKF
jgi:Ribbon-helix-helix protein, copG family.